ncbi:MAG: hypothetical protein AMXMBFR64_60290 [Myxococcales bacterium]
MRTRIISSVLALALASCSDAGGTVSRCVPEGQCQELLAHQSVFTSVGGDPGRGKEIFDARCSKCHGEDGKGVRGQTTVDLTSAAWQQGHTDNQVRLTILRGRGMMMPAFPLEEQELKDVVSHVRTLKIAPPVVEKGY